VRVHHSLLPKPLQPFNTRIEILSRSLISDEIGELGTELPTRPARTSCLGLTSGHVSHMTAECYGPHTVPSANTPLPVLPSVSSNMSSSVTTTLVTQARNNSGSKLVKLLLHVIRPLRAQHAYTTAAAAAVAAAAVATTAAGRGGTRHDSLGVKHPVAFCRLLAAALGLMPPPVCWVGLVSQDVGRLVEQQGVAGG